MTSDTTVKLTAAQKRDLRENVHGANADAITFKADGSIRLRHSYFYSNLSLEAFDRQVRYWFAKHGFTSTTVSKQNRWAPWPRESYLEVIVTVAPLLVLDAGAAKGGC